MSPLVSATRSADVRQKDSAWRTGGSPDVVEAQQGFIDQHDRWPRVTDGRYAADGKALLRARNRHSHVKFSLRLPLPPSFRHALVTRGDEPGRPLVAVRKTSDLAISAAAQPIAAAASAAVRVPASNSSTVKRSLSTA
jgi:hypothetical protein